MEDREGRVWIGIVGDGLYRYDGASFFLYSQKDGLASAHIQSLLQDTNGTIWVGTSGGAYRYDGTKFVNFTRDQVGR